MKEEIFANVKDQLGYCGIYCGVCAMGNGTIMSTAEKLDEFVELYKFKEWIHFCPGGKDFNFQDFKKGVEWFKTGSGCPGCIKGGGPPDCNIRACAREKGFNNCSECEEFFNCEKMNWLDKAHPKLREDLKKIKEIGKEKFIEEQLSGMG